jgi:ribonuclease P protein component
MNKEKTIKKNHQFRWIIKKGKKVNKKTVRVFITNNKEKKNKMGIAIKKNIKSAILRNRVKRVIREVYRLEEKKLKQHYNIIICFNTDSVNYNDIYSDIKKAFYELDIYIDKG